MDEEPRNVKDLLVEAKDASDLMVDLAYAAVFFDDDKLAREVEKLERRMGAYLRRLRTMAMLAARSPEDADEVSGRVKVRTGSPGTGRSLRDLSLPTETGMWVMAIRRGTDWDFGPGA